MFVPTRKAIGCSEHLPDMWLSTLGDRRAQQLRSVTATFVFELNYTTFKTRRGQKSKIICSTRAGQLSLCPITTLKSTKLSFIVVSKVVYLNYPNIYCELKATITCQTYAPCWKSSFPGLSKNNFLVTPFSPCILIQTLAFVPAIALSDVPVLTSYSEVRRIQYHIN